MNVRARDEFLAQALDPSKCFLCGNTVSENARTAEHVFPKWMQKEVELWNRNLTLLNGTVIPYRQLTITCCHDCNHFHLGKLERQVSAAFRHGADAVRVLDPEVLYLWLGKIYYGLLFRELTLRSDRHDPLSEEMITNAEVLREFRVHHMLLRRAIGQVTWNPFPASIFIFDALTSDRAPANFDYCDAIEQPFLTIRCSHTYLAAFLQDFGAARAFGVGNFQQVKAAAGLVLHPLQCVELDALFLTVLKQHHPAKLVLGQGPYGCDVIASPPGGLSGLPPYEPWDSDLYQDMLKATLMTGREAASWPEGAAFQA